MRGCTIYISFLAAAILVLSGCAHLAPQPNTGPAFQYPQDAFAFANETVFTYKDGVPVADDPPATRTEERFTRRCFVMSRSAVQFWKYAAFEPNEPPVDHAELAHRIRQVIAKTIWGPCVPTKERVKFPGFASLRDLSEREGSVVRANLNSGWLAYFHPRNFCMPFVPSPAHQAKANDELQRWLRRGHPMILWLYNFPHVNMNHVVVVYQQKPAEGKSAYLCYDPNYTDRPRTLEYDPATRAFSYEKTFYFPGGVVHARPIYLSSLQ